MSTEDWFLTVVASAVLGPPAIVILIGWTKLWWEMIKEVLE